MKIRYQPPAGQQTITIPYFLSGDEVDAEGNRTGSEFRTWSAGDERDVPDDLRVPFNVTNNAFVLREGKVEAGELRGTMRLVRAVDALLSVGPMFVDAATGKHPDFTCSVCGAETRDLWFHDPNHIDPSVAVDADNPAADSRVWYTSTGTPDGDKLCQRDFLIRNPRYITRHEQLEGADMNMLKDARRISDDVRIKAEQQRVAAAKEDPSADRAAAPSEGTAQ